MKRWFIGYAVLAMAGWVCAKKPVDYVDPMIGAVTYRQDTKDHHDWVKLFRGRRLRSV